MRITFLIKFYIFFLLNILCLTKLIDAQIKFYAETDNKKVGKASYIQVEFTVKNARHVDHITPPSFDNFNVISGPMQQSGMTITNGNTDQFVSIVYILQAKKTGKFTIGKASSLADGKMYYSSPLTVEVTNNGPNAPPKQNNFPFSLDETDISPIHEYDDYILKKGESVPEKIKRNVFVKVDVSKMSCYVGEPIIATYKLYSRLKSESSIGKTPSFNGFSVIELGKPDGYNITTENINGRSYNVYTLRKVELYPLQSGTLTLEPLEVENKITFIDEKKNTNVQDLQNLLQGLANGTGGSDGLVEQTVILKNKPVLINVKPLPENETDKSFKGAVGNFEISDSLDNATTSVEDGGKLIVTLKGSGNIQMVNAPKVNWPSGIEGFEPKSSEKLDKLSVPVSGEKVFEYPYNATKTGKYTIPSLSFTYFDPKANRFQTVSTSSLEVTVNNYSRNNNYKKLSGNNNSTSKSHSLFSVTGWIYISGIILLILLLFLFNYNEHTKKRTVVENTISKTTVIEIKEKYYSINALKKLEELLQEGDSKKFYEALKNELKQFIGYKMDLPYEDLTRKKMNELLDQHNVSTNTTIIFNNLMDDINRHLYGGLTPEYEMKEAYEKSIELVQLLEKQIV